MNRQPENPEDQRPAAKDAPSFVLPEWVGEALLVVLLAGALFMTVFGA